MTTTQTPSLLPPELACLDTLTSADVKRRGWRGVEDEAQQHPVLVTSHRKPRAVVLSVEAYLELVRSQATARASAADPLAALRSRFDARLEVLRRADATGKLCDAFEATPADLARTAASPLLAG